MITMHFNKKDIMATAWANARTAAIRFGGKPSQYISKCMKAAWALAKSIIHAVAVMADEMLTTEPTKPAKPVEVVSELVIVANDGKVFKNIAQRHVGAYNKMLDKRGSSTTATIKVHKRRVNKPTTAPLKAKHLDPVHARVGLS